MLKAELKEFKVPPHVKIEISDKFRDILMQFEKDSIVARILLSGHVCVEDLVDDHVNYISVCNKDQNLISYLDQDRMITVSDPDFNFWTFKKRVVCKPGGFVKRLFKNMPDKEVEKFSNHYRAIVNKKPMEFRVVHGEDIKKYYLADNYSQQRGSLGSSCMKYPHCQPFLDFYVKNSDVVSMLVLFDPADFAIGRSLLWNFKDKEGKEVKIMDRIYTISDSEYQLKFKTWALENGYLNKVNQNFSDTFGLEKLGDPKVHVKAEIKLTNSTSEKYPYFDTFKWLNKKTGVLSNFRPEPSDDIVTLACPDGNVQGYNYMNLCEINNIYHYGHEVVHVPYVKKFVHATFAVYSEVNHAYILKEDSVRNEEIRDWLFADDSRNDQVALKKRIKYFKKAEKEKPPVVDTFTGTWGSTSYSGSYWTDTYAAPVAQNLTIIDDQSGRVEITQRVDGGVEVTNTNQISDVAVLEDIMVAEAIASTSVAEVEQSIRRSNRRGGRINNIYIDYNSMLGTNPCVEIPIVEVPEGAIETI